MEADAQRIAREYLYAQVKKRNDLIEQRELCKSDLYFLLTIACQRRDMKKDWIFHRCNEVQANPDGNIDLWFREGYKSSIITFGLTIQEILKNPEITFGLFSHTRPMAKAFLGQIKREFESNEYLKTLFPDILYQIPHKESPKWSLDDGVIVKRKGNPKESTIEAWGIVDGQPTSKHFNILVYDDLVTKESVSSPEQIQKTTDAWALSLNLGSQETKVRYIGTRYHFADTYTIIIERNAAKPRIHPATEDGTFNGKPVLWTKTIFDKKVAEQGPFVASAQLLLNPVQDKAQSLDKDWLRIYDQMGDHDRWNKYILVDAANAKKKGSDYTVMAVIGLSPDKNYYLLHAIRDRMNLVERTKRLFDLVRQWNPIAVGYETYGLMADTQHIRYVQEQENFRFRIIELGGSMPKIDRIKRLIPILANNRFWFPHRLQFISVEGKARDFMIEFLNEEYSAFPVCKHDDALDCISRICDSELSTVFPGTVQPMPFISNMSGEPEIAKHDYDPLSYNEDKYDPLAEKQEKKEYGYRFYQ